MMNCNLWKDMLSWVFFLRLFGIIFMGSIFNLAWRKNCSFFHKEVWTLEGDDEI